MIASIMCSDAEHLMVYESVKELFSAATVQRVVSIPKDMGHDDVLVVGHESVCTLKHAAPIGSHQVFVAHKGKLFCLSQREELVSWRASFLEAKQWKKAKAVNDVLLDMDFLLRDARSLGYPDYVQIETTSFCNARCIMCSHYFSNNQDAAFLGTDTIESMRDCLELSRTVSLNGMGEPFASRDVCDQIDFYAALGNKAVTNTNLSILNDRLVRQIHDHFEWLEISCDGATTETYEGIRRGLKFDVIMRNLERLRDECPNVRKHITAVVMRQNVREMPALVRLGKWAGAKVVTFMTLNANIVIGNALDEMHLYPKVLQYYSARAIEAGKELGIDVVVPNKESIDWGLTESDIVDELERMDGLAPQKSPGDEAKMMRTAAVVREYLETHDEIQRDTEASTVACHGICDWVLGRSYVDLKGNVAMCCRNQSFHMGNVNEAGSFGAVWNGEFYRKIREIFYSGYLPESCLKCGLVECGGLKFLEVEMTDDFYRDSPHKQRQKAILRGLLEDDYA